MVVVVPRGASGAVPSVDKGRHERTRLQWNGMYFHSLRRQKGRHETGRAGSPDLKDTGLLLELVRPKAICPRPTGLALVLLTSEKETFPQGLLLVLLWVRNHPVLSVAT